MTSCTLPGAPSGGSAPLRGIVGLRWIVPLLAFFAVTLLPFVLVALMADQFGDDLATANAYASATASLAESGPGSALPETPQPR